MLRILYIEKKKNIYNPEFALEMENSSDQTERAVYSRKNRLTLKSHRNRRWICAFLAL